MRSSLRWRDCRREPDCTRWIRARRVPAFPHLHEDNIRKGFIEDNDYQKLAGASPDLWLRALLEVARTYGWRKRELLNMRVSQVDLKAGTLRLSRAQQRTKTVAK